MSRIKKHPLFAALAVLALLLSACGGSDATADDAAADDSATATETTLPDAEVTTTAPAETETTETTEPADAPVEEEAPAVPVSLFEWTVDAPTTITGGTVMFEVSNTGTFPHEFSIARGDSYETLPQLDNGAVDEETLGADWVGRTDRVAPGETTTISFDLEPGNYVFLCNINSGPNAHAAQGQVLSVTVT